MEKIYEITMKKVNNTAEKTNAKPHLPFLLFSKYRRFNINGELC